MNLNEIVPKIEHFCLYQERTEKEVKLKLKTFGLNFAEINHILDCLKEEGFVNDKRYATNYIQVKLAGGNWGKVKIQHYLLLKGISKKMSESLFDSLVDEEQYRENLRKVINRRRDDLKSLDSGSYTKLFNYLLSKGYESDLITEEMKNI